MGTSVVQDVTLATDDVVKCNDGWEITTEDGAKTKISDICNCSDKISYQVECNRELR